MREGERGRRGKKDKQLIPRFFSRSFSMCSVSSLVRRPAGEAVSPRILGRRSGGRDRWCSDKSLLYGWFLVQWWASSSTTSEKFAQRNTSSWRRFWQKAAHIHTHTHTHTHMHAHTDTHRCNTHMHAHARAHTHTCMRTHVHTHTHTVNTTKSNAQ